MSQVKWREGQRVRAVMRIAFDDFGVENFVHAQAGDEGQVVHVQGEATVRFDRTSTATVVGDEAIEPVISVH